MRVAYETMLAEFKRVLLKYGFDEKRAEEAAEIFAQNSLSGVPSHGLNRFPVVVDYLKKGAIDPKAVPECVASFGAMERFDGHLGFGPLGARTAMMRAIELSKQYGIRLVAIGNNNHWMRGGTYGWLAAEAGCIGICWSNTMPNMPAFGAKDNHIGNNPLIMAIPKSDGNHVMVDCALSQFSYGKLETMRLAGKELPVPGGYDEEGNLSKDPAAIEKSMRMLPIGFWKGSGLSIALDMIATVLTNANSVAKIGTFDTESGLSQVMIAMDPSKFQSDTITDDIITAIAEDIKSSVPEKEGGEIRLPGERELKIRKENLQNGIEVVEEKWAEVQAM
ncbi:MAG: 3-dehydro-L-gulonate 2-dehydrogenase [Lachnospiraceae bacterium]|nr:3-dehydro-L-gulonate 2-dehydrogenase [Lachnospiraceae bacterium]